MNEGEFITVFTSKKLKFSQIKTLKMLNGIVLVTKNNTISSVCICDFENIFGYPVLA